MKFKNVKVGLKIQHKATGKVVTITRLGDYDFVINTAVPSKGAPEGREWITVFNDRSPSAPNVHDFRIYKG